MVSANNYWVLILWLWAICNYGFWVNFPVTVQKKIVRNLSWTEPPVPPPQQAEVHGLPEQRVHHGLGLHLQVSWRTT